MDRDKSPIEAATAAWERCWENLLCLPAQAFSADDLFSAARRLVHVCRFETDNCGIGWFERELENAQLFVVEQRAADPQDLEWLRIEVVLAGARSALRCPSDAGNTAAGAYQPRVEQNLILH